MSLCRCPASVHGLLRRMFIAENVAHTIHQTIMSGTHTTADSGGSPGGSLSGAAGHKKNAAANRTHATTVRPTNSLLLR